MSEKNPNSAQQSDQEVSDVVVPVCENTAAPPIYEAREEQVLPSSVWTRARNLTLDDCVFYADQQYHSNDTQPIESMAGGGSVNTKGLLFKFIGWNNRPLAIAEPVRAEKTEEPPGPTIRSSPLRFIWGPESPSIRTEEPKDGQVTVPQAYTSVIRAEDIDPTAEANQDILDRLLLRRVTWLRCIFLLTTDILGPFQAPYVYSQVGFVPGTIVFLVMGVMAYLTGCILNVLYLRIDSDKIPVRTFGDIVYRIWGFWGKTIVDIFFIIQLLFSSGLLLLTSAQNVGLIIDGSHTNKDGSPRNHICFSVMIMIFMFITLSFSFIRSLKPIGKLSSINLALSFIAVIIATTFIYISPPNYEQAMASAGIRKGPVSATAFVSLPLASKVNGIMNMVYAFGGSMLFPNFCAEMRKPWDFYKSYFVAEALIVMFYVTVGTLIYARQGQFTQPLFYYGVSKYAYQTVGNAIATYGGVVAALLYGNIVQKEVYHLVVRTWFKGPRLMSRQAYPYYMIGNIFVWGSAYVIAASIPQVGTVAGVIGAATVLQFSFSFPFLMKLSFDMQVDAMKGDHPYAPGALGKRDHRVDTWRQWSRWHRAVFSGNVCGKAVFLVFGLASVAMAGLGLYGSIETIIATFKSAKAVSFGCATP